MSKFRECLNTTWHSPYRLFFTAGTLLGIASIGIWAFFATGIEYFNFYPGFHHIFGVVSLFLGSFVMGFLLTALPRFTSTAPPKAILIYTIASVLIAEVIALVKNSIPSALFLCSLKFFILLFFALSRLKNAKVSPPPSFIWIGTGLLSVVLGAAGKGFVECGILQNQSVAQFFHLAFTRGYILSLFMGVGSLLIPILSGVKVNLTPAKLNKDFQLQKKRLKIVHIILAIILFTGLAVEASYQNDFILKLGLSLQLFVVTTEVIGIWKMHKKPEATSRGRALFIASWAMIVGFALAIIFPYQRIHFLHIVFILGFLGATLTIGSHVLVNHEAMDQALLKKNWPLGFITLSLILITILRIAGSFWQNYYLVFLGSASSLLTFTLSLWAGYFIKPLWKKESLS